MIWTILLVLLAVGWTVNATVFAIRESWGYSLMNTALATAAFSWALLR